MEYSVAQLAEMVHGVLAGDGSAMVRAAVPFHEAGPNTITFLSDKRHEAKLSESHAAAVLVPSTFKPVNRTVITVENPLAAILRIAALFVPPVEKPKALVDARAAVDESARIGPGCHVGPFAVIEADCVLGDGCIVHPHAVIRAGSVLGRQVEVHPHAVLYPRTIVGERTIIHSGAVIGCDGFGYQPSADGHRKVPQIGHVHIGADVEIGANSTIDRATFGTTRIGDGSKIDNQVMIAHNCQIGKNNLIVAQVGIAGSSTTGDDVVLAGKVGIADHVNIGRGAVVGANAGIFTDVPAGQRYLGVPARPEREFKRLHVALERVPEMRKQLAEILERLSIPRNGHVNGESKATCAEVEK